MSALIHVALWVAGFEYPAVAGGDDAPIGPRAWRWVP